jgi:circadian clock protein KaiC
MHHAVELTNPDVVVVDPITNLMTVGTQSDVRSMLTRVIDFLKTRGVTALFTSLTSSTSNLEETEAMISSLMDTWVLVAVDTVTTRRSRHLYVLKSRGMPHSDEVRPFRITSHGVDIGASTAPPVGRTPVAARAAPRAAKRAPRRPK